MNGKMLRLAAVFAVIGSLAVAQTSEEQKPAAETPQMQLPPGWTPADMQAAMAAATPGKMQEFLTEGAGVWHCENTMWMYPGAEPIASEATSTVTPMMGGRYVKIEIAGEMPGMGPFRGFTINGFDNVSKQFVSTWIDNMSTGIMHGTGELSSDNKTLTWTYNYHCPITKKPTVMRQVETITGPDSRTMEMFGADPKSGKEFQMMKIELTRESENPNRGTNSAGTKPAS